MKKRIYSAGDYKTTVWSGGKTTEFAIYPETAKYAERNFIWRLSSATVELEESIFTELLDYNRVLMVLEGEATLIHGENKIVKLGKLHQDSFGGDVGTKCFGKIRDYNLMFRKDSRGYLKLLELQNFTEILKKPDWKNYTDASYGLYCFEGKVTVSVNGESHEMKEGALFLLDFNINEKAEVNVRGTGKVIVSEVFYTE